ncbi:MAG: GntR family transcriptional regulator [Alphaproteobacteria bacterium]|nr:MAG: GntR family transcriptional regulator [Alphaproteobacteria bacterium]
MPRSKSNKKDEVSERKIAHEETYKTLYYAIITGRFEPGKVLTIRGVAQQLGCSPMPVREAVRRLVALGALEMRSTRRLSVALMTRERFQEIWSARTMLEPEIAARAMPHSDKQLIRELERIDNQIAEAMKKGDPDSYTLKNWEFHFTLYRAANCPIFLRLIESVWLQFGPFMRMVTGRLGTSLLVDQHEMAVEALKRKDEAGLREAIRLDIKDGMSRIGSDFPE